MAKILEPSAAQIGPKSTKASARPSGDAPPQSAWTKVGPGGRVVLPAAMREALGLAPGDDVLISLEAEGIRILPRDEAIRQAQAIVRELVPDGVSLAEELIADRRREAARESDDD